MNEFEYHNSTLTSPERNSSGQEFNQDLLNDTTSKAGARDFNYSKKTQEKAIENVTTASTSTTPTVVGTSATVGGVIIASVVIYTSVLGNQYRLVDNSLALNTYRDVETNQINLDYSFDLQYDKSGTVYVKLVSSAHSLTSEPYEIYYEEHKEEYIYEEVDPENEGEFKEPEVIEKEKEIFTMRIDGTFEGLLESNDYTFAITSIIDGTENQIYAQKLYIPSSYATVADAYYELYKEEDDINLSYGFYLEYEKQTEVIVQLKRFEEGNFVVEQVSEPITLEVSSTDEHEFMNEVSGQFTGLIEYGDYILSVITKCDGQENTPYSERFYAYVQEQRKVYTLVNDPLVEFKARNGLIYLDYSLDVYGEFDGYLYVELIDPETGDVYASQELHLPADANIQHLEESFEVKGDQEYQLVVTSCVEDWEEQIYSGNYYASIEYGYIDSCNFDCIYYTNSDGEVTHKFSYYVSYCTFVNLESLRFEILDSNRNLIHSQQLASNVEFLSEGESMYLEYEDVIEINEAGPYTVVVYSTYYEENSIFESSFDETQSPFFDFSKEDVTTTVYAENGEAKLSLGVDIATTQEGSIYFELINQDTNEVQTSNYISPANGAQSVEFDIPDITADYTLKAHSFIEEDVLVYTDTISPDGVFGSISTDISVQSVNDGNKMVYILNYGFTSDLVGKTYYTVTLADETVYTSEKVDCQAQESVEINEEINDLVAGNTYTITAYGNWGREDKVLSEVEYVATSYGIEINSDTIASDYENSTLTIPYTLNDASGYLSDITASVTVSDGDDGQNIYSGTLTTVDEQTVFRFDMTGAIKGTYGILKVTATDSNNNNATTQFVQIAIWY